MSIAELFIKRPVMTTLVMFSILLAGFMGYRLLPVSALPNVDFPTIVVSASLPGASPETMAASVATPLERQFSTIAGVDSMTSTNVQGNTQITLQFILSRNIDAAAEDVQAAIALAQRKLPPEMPSPPFYRKVNPADQPILMLSISSSILPLSTVDEYAETYMAQRISMVDGVAQVQVYGSQKYAVRAQVDPKILATMGIGLDEVEAAINNGNVNLPSGSLDGKYKAFTVQANGQLMSASDYRPLIVTYRNGSPVRLGSLGKVIDSVENIKAATWYYKSSNASVVSGSQSMERWRSIVLAIQRQPGTNTVAVVDDIRSLLPAFKEKLPPSINMEILYDRSQSIRSSVNDVKFTLVLTIILVVLVIFFFIRNLSATVIPSLALPMSLIGTFAVMYLLNFSVDNLSLMAMTLSVGFVVDDAIVMLENIVRHREMGESAMEAALKGSREIGFTIVSMTLSLSAVFIPVLFMGGIMGRLFHEFAVTIGVAVLISGFISLSLTPMLCSRFIRSPENIKHSHLYALSEILFTGMLRSYEWSLKLAMKVKLVMVIIFFILLFGTFYFLKATPKGFLPSDDIGMLMGITEAAQGVSFQYMLRHQQEVAKIVSEDPNISAFMSGVGSGGMIGGSNAGRMFIRLTPRPPRQLSADDIIQELRVKLASIPGIKTYLQNPPPISVGGMFTKSQYQFAIQGPDTDELYHYAPILEAKMRELPGFQEVTTDLQINNPQVEIDINRDMASTLGVTAYQIEDALYTAYGTRQVSTIYAPNNDYQVILELDPKYQNDPSVLSMLYIRSNSNQLVPLDTCATVKQDLGPLSVNHQGQLPAVTLSFNLKPGTSLGDAVNSVKSAASSILPATMTTSFQGTAKAFEASMKGMGLLLIMTVFVIYIVLGILYESFFHPLTILTGLPAAGVGALLTLWLFHMDLNLYSIVGIIMLVGIVKKNAIMMIDFALAAQRNEGKSPEEAIVKGCLIRFRPIMMTTMAAMMGALPIALGIGTSGSARRPLGLAIVGGLVLSQFLTLYITPVFYTYMEKVRNLWKRAV